MFNSYIAERRLQTVRRRQEIQKKEIQIKKRYHTQVQPVLLQHYQKRLRSFIEKMNTNPVVINPQNLLPPIKQLPHFTFRDADDWKSIKFHYAHHQNRKNKNVDDQKQDVQRYSTVSSQSRSVYKHEFRSRERVKQRQPPMRFKSVQKFIQTKKKKNTTTKQFVKEKVELTQKAQNLFGLRDTFISISNTTGIKMDEEEIQFLLNRQKNDIELQARKYEKQREPDEKKLHFKKIADLALTEKDEFRKKDLRQILRKSGYSKIKRMNFTDIPETDNFSVLVQKITVK